jgi:hypothetical protein
MYLPNSAFFFSLLERLDALADLRRYFALFLEEMPVDLALVA